MLVIELVMDEFAAIGDAIISLQRTRRGKARLIVDGPTDLKVLRFNADGSMRSKPKVVKCVKPIRGVLDQVNVDLSCGHSVRVDVKSLANSIFCTECEKLAASLHDRIQEIIRNKAQISNAGSVPAV